MSKQCRTGDRVHSLYKLLPWQGAALDSCPEARCSALTDRTNLEHWHIAAQFTLERKPHSKNRCRMDREILGKPAPVCTAA